VPWKKNSRQDLSVICNTWNTSLPHDTGTRINRILLNRSHLHFCQTTLLANNNLEGKNYLNYEFLIYYHIRIANERHWVIKLNKFIWNKADIMFVYKMVQGRECWKKRKHNGKCLYWLWKTTPIKALMKDHWG